MSSPVFQKTARGRAEVVQRSGRVPAAMRAVLIMVNGRESADALAAQGAPGAVQVHLQALLGQGLIEVIAPAAVPAPLSPAPPPPAAAAQEPELPADLIETLCHEAAQRLRTHFGPDTADVVRPMRAARTASDLQRAVDAIESRLAVYLGRKQAARCLDGLRPSA